jgi:hypothetical protein
MVLKMSCTSPDLASLAKEVPTLAARANATGAGEDPRIINALAPYGAVKSQEK